MIWETVVGGYFFWVGLVTLAVFLILLLNLKKAEMSRRATWIFALALLSWSLTLVSSVIGAKQEGIGKPVSFNAIMDGDGYIAKEAML